MEEELQVHRLPRFEKKRLVKGWHVTQAPSSNSTSTLIGEATESGSLRSLFAPPPAALAYETQRTETWRSVNFYTTDHDGLQNQEQGDTIPKTVAQVKQMYLVRARRQEERDATSAIRKREKILELRRGPRWRNQLSKTKVQKQQSTTVDLQRQDEIKEGEKTVISPQNDFNQELQLIDLPVDEVVTNATYRDEILRQIRHQLSNGGEVLLQSDCCFSKETISDTRLMIQTLCTQSLAFCTRDQTLVPNTLPQLHSSRLTLRLLPRTPFMKM